MANNIIGSLRVVLGLDSAKFERGARRAKSTVRDMQRQFAAVATAAAAFAGGLALISRRASETIDRQAKLAQSLNTTTGSIQVLERAAELAGVSLGEAGEGAARLTRRISLAAQGTGPAVKAFERLGLNLDELAQDDLITRISKVQKAIEDTIPAVERAGVLSQVFGDRAFVAFQRLDAGVLEEARRELERFGVIVSDVDAGQIEKTNDAISRLRLVAVGFGNQVATAVAPALQALADAASDFFAITGPGGRALQILGDQLGRIASIAVAAVGLFGARLAGAYIAAAAGAVSLAGALRLLRVAIIRTGIGALIVGAGEILYQFSRLVEATGSFGAAMTALGKVATAAWEAIKMSAASLVPALGAVWQDIRASFTQMIADLQRVWADFLRTFLEGLPSNTPQAVLEGLTNAAGRAEVASIRTGQAIGGMRTQAELMRQTAQNLTAAGIEKLKAALAELQATIESNKDATDEDRDALAKLQAALEDVEDSAGGAGGKVKNELTPALKDAKTESDKLRDGMAEAFSSIVRGAESARDAVGRLLDSLADSLLQSAFQNLFGGFSFFGGGGGAPSWLGGNATGTNYWKGGLTWVGERGPELVSLPRGTKVMDAARSADMAAGMGGGSVVNVSIDARGAQQGVAAQIDAALARRLPDIERAAVASVARARRRGVAV